MSFLKDAISIFFASRIFPVSVCVPIALPIMIVAATRYQTFDFLSELTVYRIGNAVSLLFDEGDNVRPVQGLPIALLAKAEIWLIALARGTYVMDVKVLASYLTIYFGVIFTSAIATISFSWPKLSTVCRCAVILFFACPWLLGGATMPLLVEPDYWVGEWCYLLISLCLLTAAPDNRDQRFAAIFVGAWLAIGVAMKITLLGIAPFFVFQLQYRSLKTVAFLLASLVLTYALMTIAYMGSIAGAIKLVLFQANFFVHPNSSIQWTDIVSVLSTRPFLLVLTLTFIFVLVTSRRAIELKVAALAWAAGMIFLVWIRPHDTSIASAATVLTFLTVYFINSASAMTAAVCLFIFGACLERFDRILWVSYVLRAGWGAPQSQQVSRPIIHDMLFLPDNYWNAGLAVEAIGYNGELGFYYPVENGPDGSARYSRGGKAFQALFPGIVMIPDSHPALEVAERALKAGQTLWWTRQEPIPAASTPGSLQRVREVVARSGATIETFKFQANGAEWLLEKAAR